MAQPTENRTLYDLGSKYARLVCRRLGSAGGKLTAIRAVASEVRAGVAEVRTACEFAMAVDAIAHVVPESRKVILDGDNPHLTPSIIDGISKKSEAGIRTAMERASLGLHPSAPPPPDDLPADRILWHYDLTRLGEARGLLERVAAVVATRNRSLRTAETTALALHTTAIRVDIEALRLVLGHEQEQRSTMVAAPPRPGDRGDVVRLASRARKLVEGVTGDFLRAAHTRSFAAVRDELVSRVRGVASLAESISANLPHSPTSVDAPTVEACPAGPGKEGGTYVEVLLANNSGVVRLGRLATFWLPEGYLLYVGSAFGGGGVRSRTNRHLNSLGPRLWNLDHLRGFAIPVELWWTHHPQKVECQWAMGLAAMPICSCPAPQTGANDCKSCPAHLFHATSRPSIQAFARRLGETGSGGYTIHYRPVQKT